jgi:acetyltransferase
VRSPWGRTKKDPVPQRRCLIGVSRLIELGDGNHGEMAVLVSDQSQGQGLGTELFRRLIQIARDERLTRVSAEMLADNLAMRRIGRRLGFRRISSPIPSSVTAILDP